MSHFNEIIRYIWSKLKNSTRKVPKCENRVFGPLILADLGGSEMAILGFRAKKWLNFFCIDFLRGTCRRDRQMISFYTGLVDFQKMQALGGP